MDTFTCYHCHLPHPKNSRHKNQTYCSSPKCQQARKNAWEQNKIKTDAAYRESRKKQKIKWYKHRPGDQYQTDYRKTHPTYQNSNKEKQRLRNRKRVQDASVSKIVKTDALIVQMVDTARYKALNTYKE